MGKAARGDGPAPPPPGLRSLTRVWEAQNCPDPRARPSDHPVSQPDAASSERAAASPGFKPSRRRPRPSWWAEAPPYTLGSTKHPLKG